MPSFTCVTWKCACDPPPCGQPPGGRKIYFDPLSSENASKNSVIIFQCQLSSEVTTQRQK